MKIFIRSLDKTIHFTFVCLFMLLPASENTHFVSTNQFATILHNLVWDYLAYVYVFIFIFFSILEKVYNSL